MLRTRTRKIFRDILARRRRTLFVLLCIFTGVLGTTILTTMGQLLVRQMERDLVPSEMAMLRVYLNPDSATTTPIDNEHVLNLLKGQTQVTAVEGQAVYQFAWRFNENEEFREGQVYSYTSGLEHQELEPIRLLDGKYPRSDASELLIEQRMADAYQLAIGDELMVTSAQAGERPWRIVGIVYQPYLYFGDTSATNNVYMTYDDSQKVVDYIGLSSIYVRFANIDAARRYSPRLRDTLNQQTPYTIVLHLVENPTENAFVVGVRRFQSVLMGLGIISMVVASFLVTNVIHIIMTEQRRQIGSMKAIGATRWDIFKIYLGMVLLYGVVATMLGLLIGIPLGQRAADLASPLANIILTERQAPPLVYILSLSLGIGVPLLAGFLPVWKGSRISILSAMSDYGIADSYGQTVIPRLIAHLPVSLTIIQALNNVFRRKGRLALSFLSLALASGAFMGMFATFARLSTIVVEIRDRLNYEVGFDLDQIQVVDLVSTFMVDNREQIRSIQPGVAIELTEYHTQPDDSSDGVAEFENPIIITGIDTAQPMIGWTLLNGIAWNIDPTRQGIVISPQMAEDFDKAVGETLTIITPTQRADFEVIGITEYPVETAFMNWQQLADFVGTIQVAPIPNAYWEKVSVQDGGAAIQTWAVGVDERVGSYLSENFDPTQPGIIISQSVADAGGYSVGETLTLTPDDNDLLDDIIVQPTPFKVIEIIDLSPTELDFVLENAPSAVSTDQGLVAVYWSQLAESVRLDYGALIPRTFRIDLADPQVPPETSTLQQPQVVATYQNEVGFADRVIQTIISVGVVMNLAALLMALVGGIGLLTITFVTIWERQREIGVMRSVGASGRVIFYQFLLEGMVVGILAWLAGLPLSYYLAKTLISNVPFHEVIPFEYSLVAPLVGLVGMILVTLLATFYPAMSAAKRTVSDILRYG